MLRSFLGGAVFGTYHGAGQPWVLALHGWRRTRADFDRVLAPVGGVPLASLALDLPGFGASPAPPESWGSNEYSLVVEKVLADLVTSSAASAVVVGHSFGGRVALRLAVRRPDLVAALVLSGVPLLPPAGGRKKPSPALRIARSLHRRGLVSDARMEAYRVRRGSEDYKAATGVMRDTLVKVVNEDYSQDLLSLSVPIELVWGERDTVAPLEAARRAAAMVAGSTLTVSSAAGHILPLEDPASLREALLRHRP